MSRFCRKADSVEGRGATNCVQREISIQWLPMGLFGKLICYLSVELHIWKNGTATSEE